MSVTSLRKTFYVYHQLNKWQDRPATSMNFVLKHTLESGVYRLETNTQASKPWLELHKTGH